MVWMKPAPAPKAEARLHGQLYREWRVLFQRLRYRGDRRSMPVAEPPPAHGAKRHQYALTIEHTDEGWWAARVEGTGAFSQGRTRDEALRNLLSAYRDLHHQPTATDFFRRNALTVWCNLRERLPTR